MAMTVEQIQERVRRIEATAQQNNAKGHQYEDDLYTDVLVAIAQGADNPAELARAALAATDLKFDRGYSLDSI